MATTPDYAIISSPRISAAKFAAVLRAGSSPAAAEADACYRAIAATGVDPAVALAVFRKESTFGRFGRANRNRSWGNIRGGTTYPLDSGHFRIYPSWTAGAADIGRLLAVYGSNRIRPGTRTDSVQTMPYVWAPSSDGNAPDAYGDTLARWIADWTGQPGSSSSGPNADQASFDGTPGSADFQRWQAALATIGIPNDPSHVITHDEAVKIVDVLYKGQIPSSARDSTIASFEGKTVGQAAGPAGVNFGGDINPLSPVADAIAGLAVGLGDVVMHGIILVGLLIVVLLGVYLIATADE